MVRWIFGGTGSLLVLMACSGSDATAVSDNADAATSTPEADAGDASSADAPFADAPLADASSGCGLLIGWKTDVAACQSWVDQACCNEERACAQDSTCSAHVACVNACAIPRSDTCIEECGDTFPPALDAFATCTKNTSVQEPAKCAWP